MIQLGKLPRNLGMTGIGFARSRARFSPAARDYFDRLDAAGLRVNTYDKANARLIDRLVANGSNFWPNSGAFNAMAGYLFPTAGTLIPLKDGHNAGTLNAFVTGDWNAVTGLKGDGSTKYVNSNRNNNADGQNDQAIGVYVSALGTKTTDASLIGAGGAATGANVINRNIATGILIARSRSAAGDSGTLGADWLGLNSLSRSAEANYIRFRLGSPTTIVRKSEIPYNGNLGVFARESGGSFGLMSDDRLPFYHIGPNLNGAGELAELDSILTDWQTDLANA
jgi:hypothetical protein